MNLRRLIRKIIDKRYLIYYLTVGFGVIFLIYGLIIPKTYLSEGQILPQMDISGILELSGTISSLAGQESKMMRAAKAAGVSFGYSSADIINAMLTSRTVMEAVVTDCDIFNAYNIKRSSIERALKRLRSLTGIEVTREEIVRIKCLGKTPEFAAKLVNSYIRNLDLFLKEKSMSKGKNMRIFLERRLSEAEAELKASMDSLKTYQERTKVIVPDEELRAAIAAYASLKGKQYAKEVELEISKEYSSENAPYYSQLKIETDAIKNKLAEIESKGVLKDGFGIGFGVSLKKVPEVIQIYYRKYLDTKVQEEIYSFLRQQYEQARIIEIKDTPVITVVDWGKPPERKHSPKILKLLIFGLLAGFLVSIVICIYTLFLEELFKNKEREQLFKELKETLIGDIRKFPHLFSLRKKH